MLFILLLILKLPLPACLPTCTTPQDVVCVWNKSIDFRHRGPLPQDNYWRATDLKTAVVTDARREAPAEREARAVILRDTLLASIASAAPLVYIYIYIYIFGDTFANHICWKYIDFSNFMFSSHFIFH